MAMLTIAGHLSAQTDFRPGFIVNNTGDTLRGWVDYRTGVKNFRTCSFKKDGGEPVTYLPADIRGYGFTNDKRHLSRTVETADKVKEFVFLEVLVSGRASLYKFMNSLYLEKDTSLVRLSNDAYETYINGQRVVVESKKYIGVLTHMLHDCEKIRAKIPRLHLIEKSMTRIVETYNACVGQASVVYKEKKPWIALKPAIYGGLEISTVSIRGTAELDYFNTDTHAASSPLAGLSADIEFPRINERFSLHVGVSYSGTRYKMYQKLNTSPGRSETMFNSNSRKLPSP